MDWERKHDNFWILHVAGFSISLITNKRGYEVACTHIFPAGKTFRAGNVSKAKEMALQMVYEQAKAMAESYTDLAFCLGQKLVKNGVSVGESENNQEAVSGDDS